METQKRNYDKIMIEQIKQAQRGEKLLLHSCCAPCSSACLERLKDAFDITVLYYNPNIDEESEYQKRKAEQIRFLQQTGWAKIIDCDYDKQAFESIAQGLEDQPERGKRCYLCYKLRLDKTAQTAKVLGFSWFCTTLTLSPHKNAEWLNALGVLAEQQYGVRYLYSDFKKQGGYYRSVDLSKEYGLYRQDFCGCQYSKRKNEP